MLPAIGQRADEQLVQSTALTPVPDDDRIKVLETRLAVGERANRTLLDEVVRLQSSLAQAIRRQEEMLTKEKLTEDQQQVYMFMCPQIQTFYFISLLLPVFFQQLYVRTHIKVLP